MNIELLKKNCSSLVVLLLILCSESALAQNSVLLTAEGVLYFPIPTDVSKEEILNPGERLKVRLHSLVIESLTMRSRLSQETGDLIEGKEDLVVVFTDHAGQPILPDLDAARSRRSDASRLSAPVATATNELAFTFDSSTFPWSAEQLITLSTAMNDFYRTAKVIYGDPAFNITVNIRKDPTISFAGLYYSSINEMVLRDESNLDVFCHEMIHAFRDDNTINFNSYEEGMTRAAEIEVFNRLDGYTHPFNESHSYPLDVYYEGLNRRVIGSLNGSFFNSFPYAFALLRYQLAGYAWAKVFLENSNFFVDFNRELYARTLSDPSTVSMESKLLDIATTVQSMVEGRPFLTWYGQQGVLNTNPPEGYFLYQRINQFDVNYFYRDAWGAETMQPDATIQWAIYDDQNSLLDSGSDVTDTYGRIYIDRILPAGYAGRIKVVATTSIPDGNICDISLRTAGNEAGVFGVVPESNSGTITITPLDHPTPPVTLDVANGAFSVPSLAAVKGRFLAHFTNATGQGFSKQFNKDASDYFLFMGKVVPPVIKTMWDSPDPFSPNGDVIRDTTTIKATFSEVVKWNLTIQNSSGTTVRSFTNCGASLSSIWNGLDKDGILVPDGKYTYRLEAIDSTESSAVKSTQGTVDTHPPSLTNLSDAPDPFKNHLGETTKIRYALSEKSNVTIKIFNSAGVLVRTLFSNVSKPAGANTSIWNGKNDACKLVSSGTYTYKIFAADIAGNKASRYPATGTVRVQ